MMGYVSIKLTGILAIIGPPVALVAFFSGRGLRNVSRKIQKNLGTLTKIAEERLGNVKTSQAFAGEVQEAGRYNRQIKRIFELGKKEAMIAASFYGSTGLMGNLTVIAVLYAGGGMVKSGAISIGELSSFLMYCSNFRIEPLRYPRLSASRSNLREGRLSSRMSHLVILRGRPLPFSKTSTSPSNKVLTWPLWRLVEPESLPLRVYCCGSTYPLRARS
jgi:ABC-type multidrug transport system fused ATPase/permease subunit